MFVLLFFNHSFHTLLSRSNGVSVFCFLSSLPFSPQPSRQCLAQRDERGWPLLTQRHQMKEVLSWLVRWASRAVTRDFFFAFVALVRPVTKYFFFLTVHYFMSFFPIAQQAGQAAVLGRLSLSLCLWFGSHRSSLYS